MTPNLRTCDRNQQGSVSTKVARLLRLYVDDLALRYAARTGETYLASLQVFLAWLTGQGVDLGEVRTEDVESYLSHFYAQRKENGAAYAPATQAARLTAIKSFFHFLYRRGYLVRDPAAPVEFPRLDQRLPRYILTRSEALSIMRAVARARSPLALRDRAILETLYATGLRVGELVRLAPAHVDTEERTVRVHLGKGGKDRTVPLTRPAAAALDAYASHGRPQLVRPRGSRLLFLASRGGALRRSEVGRIVGHWSRRAGITKRVTCHTFRHTVATHLLKGGADIRHIQVLLGHATLSTTERYTRVEIQDLREVVARAHPRGR